MSRLFLSILLTSCVGSFLTLLLVVFRPQTKKRFSANWHYYMWLVVLFVMLCPVRLVLPHQSADTHTIIPLRQQESTEIRPVEPSAIITEQMTIPPVAEDSNAVLATEENAVFDWQMALSVVAALWFFGFLCMIVFKAVGYIYLLYKIYRQSEKTEKISLGAYTKRQVSVRISDSICSPLVVGAIKPMLLLPKTPLTDTQMDSVLSHEMMHVNRMDILYKWLVCLTKCIHWFNPVVYYIGRKVNLDCEIACDAAVTKEMDMQEKSSYMETILALLSGNNQRVLPLTTGMTGEKKSLSVRFSALKNKLHISKKVMALSIAIAVFLLVFAIIGSGLLNGVLVPSEQEMLLQVSTDARQGDDFNVLLLGLDDSGRADTIMLLLYKEGHITGISIPRDAVFTVSGTDSLQKISEMLAGDNGDQTVIDTVKKQLSIPITYYTKINLTALRDIVDALGGVEFDVPAGVIYDDPAQDLHINIAPGVRVLSGEEVCGLLRFRGTNYGRVYPRGDLDRVALGQSFIQELIKQKSNKETLKKLPVIFEKIKENIQTNYPFEDFVKDARKLQDAESDVTFTTYTTPGVLKTMYGGQIVYDLETGDVVATQSYPSFESSWPENDVAKIKSLAKAGEPYPGFEHVVLQDKTGKQIETILQSQGLSAHTGSKVNLKTNYAVRPYDGKTVQVQADDNGNISLYMPGYEQNYKVQFYDGVTNEDVGGYLVLGNDTNAYTFLGFLQGKTYYMTVEGATGTDWAQSGKYYIY